MPTHQDETLLQRYTRENQDYLKLCGSMTAEQVADLQLQLNNALAREQVLQLRLNATDERADLLEGLLRNARNKLSFGPEDTKAIDAALRKAAVAGDDLDDHDRSAQAYWADQAAQGKPYEQQLREACERNGIDLMRDTD